LSRVHSVQHTQVLLHTVMYLVWVGIARGCGCEIIQPNSLPRDPLQSAIQYCICIPTPLCIGHLLYLQSFLCVKCYCKYQQFTENCLLRAALAARLVKKARKIAFTLGKKHRNIERKNGRLVINAPGVFFMIECFITFV